MHAGGWIFEDNVVPILLLLADAVGYKFDAADLAAVEYGLKESDPDEDRWFEYPLIGQQTATVRIAQEPGSSIVELEIDAPGEAEYFRALLVVAQSYWLTNRHDA